MPTNKLEEDRLNEWARNWRRQQEEMSRQSQYQTQNQTPYNTSAPTWQQTPYQPQARSFAAQHVVQQPQQASAQTSVISPEIANAAFQKGFESKKPGFFSKNTVTQAMSNVGKAAFNAAFPVYGGAQTVYKTGEDIFKRTDAYQASYGYPFQKDDVTIDNVGVSSWDAVKGLGSLYDAKKLYDEYTPLRYNDKYKHAMLNCKLAQQGKPEVWAADHLSRIKEMTDVMTGGNTLSESYADMQANLQGRKLGYNNPNGDCDQMVQQYYPKYYPKK